LVPFGFFDRGNPDPQVVQEQFEKEMWINGRPWIVPDENDPSYVDDWKALVKG
jgi:hypothetical protein